MKIFVIGFAIASVVSAVVGVVLSLRLGEMALKIIQYFSGQLPAERAAGFTQPLFCKQCRAWANHDPGCPSFSTEAQLIFDQGVRDAWQNRPLAWPNHPSYTLARRLYGSSTGPEEARTRMAAMSSKAATDA